MGCSQSKKPDPQGSVMKNNSNLEKEIEKKLLPMLEINNEHNINKKYDYLMEIIPDKFTGINIYQTNAYKCKVP